MSAAPAPAEARRILRRVAEILTVSGGVNVHGARDLALREIAPGFLETNSFGAVVADLTHYAIHEERTGWFTRAAAEASS